MTYLFIGIFIGTLLGITGTLVYLFTPQLRTMLAPKVPKPILAAQAEKVVYEEDMTAEIPEKQGVAALGSPPDLFQRQNEADAEELKTIEGRRRALQMVQDRL